MAVNKKVVVFVQDFVGGSERMSAFIGRALSKHDYNVCYCLIKTRRKSSITDFIPNNAMIRKIQGCNVLFLIISMFWIILRERPEFVFSSVINLNNKVLLLKRFFPNIKFIIRCDNYLYTYSEKQRGYVKRLYLNADRIIAQTEEMKEELLEQTNINDGSIIVLHNPIDVELIENKIQGTSSPYPDNSFKHFVAVGRFEKQKGFDLLINAFVEAQKTREDIDLFILGDKSANDGIIANYIEDIAEKADIRDRIHMIGYNNNPYPYIRYANCFVLSSRWEGLPNVLIESLYLGTPVAAFKCIPIIERIVENGIDGFLAEKESIPSLSNAMLNSLQLNRVVSKYRPSSIEDFVSLFN